MNPFARILAVVAIAGCARAEMRTWTLASEKTVEGEFVSVLFDKVVIKDGKGREVKIPLAEISKDDVVYIELATPPQLKVDPLESLPTKQIDARTWQSNSGTIMNTDPVFVIHAQFGARITQVSNKAYHHELTAEIFILTKQLYDPAKYHYIVHSKSAPFLLTESNKRRYEYRDGREHAIMYYSHGGTQPRGEKPAESLILIRDRRGEIIAHNSTKKWLFDNHEKLLALPVGSWVDKTCDQVYPTSPKRWYN